MLPGRAAPVLKRPADRPPTHVRRICGDFAYQAASRDKPSWDKSWRVVARVERHPGDLFLKIGFVVTNLRASIYLVTLADHDSLAL